MRSPYFKSLFKKAPAFAVPTAFHRDLAVFPNPVHHCAEAEVKKMKQIGWGSVADRYFQNLSIVPTSSGVKNNLFLSVEEEATNCNYKYHAPEQYYSRKKFNRSLVPIEFFKSYEP